MACSKRAKMDTHGQYRSSSCRFSLSMLTVRLPLQRPYASCIACSHRISSWYVKLRCSSSQYPIPLAACAQGTS